MQLSVILPVCFGMAVSFLSQYLNSCSNLVGPFNRAPPLRLTLSGTGSINRAPERGILSFTVSHRGTDAFDVTHSVQETVDGIHGEMRDLARRGPDGRPLPDTAVLRWSSSGLAARTWIETYLVDSDGNEDPWVNQGYGYGDQSKYKRKTRRQHEATVKLTARFRDFKALSTLTVDLATRPFLEVDSIQWALTDETRAELRTKAIAKAYASVLAQAQAYANATGLATVRPVDISREHQDGRGWARTEPQLMSAGSASVSSGAPHLAYIPRDIAVEENCKVVFEVE